MRTHRLTSAAGALLACTFLPAPASAGMVNLVQNGSFENITFQGTATILNYPQSGGSNAFSLTYGGDFAYQAGQATVLSNWTSSAVFEYVAEPPAGTFNSEVDYDLWPGTTSLVPETSPDGGNFIIDDATQSLTGYLRQTLTGLNVGDSYTLSFYQAAGQAYPYSGSTQQQWIVSLGSSTFDSAVMTVPNEGFVPWAQQTTSFVATSTSEVLSFLGESNVDASQPPFILLDGVSLTDTTSSATPEPGGAWLAGLGILGLFGIRQLRGPKPAEIPNERRN